MRATLELLPERSELVRELRTVGDDVECVIETGGRSVRSSDSGWQPGYEGLVLLEMAGVHAQHHAHVEPTVLLLDEFLDNLHPATQIPAPRTPRAHGRARPGGRR